MTATKRFASGRGCAPPFDLSDPQGKTLTQQRVKELAGMEHLVLLCGHYEGIDERVIEELQPEEISVGDYVLTGGELPALVLADSVTRLLPGVLSDAACFEEESHYNSLLEYPSTPDRRYGGAERCRRCCFPATMPTLPSGGGSSPCSAPWSGGRISWNEWI